MRGIKTRERKEGNMMFYFYIYDVFMNDTWPSWFVYPVYVKYNSSSLWLPSLSVSSSHYFQSFRGWPHYLWCGPINSSLSDQDNQGLLLDVVHICKNDSVLLQKQCEELHSVKKPLHLDICRHLESQITCVYGLKDKQSIVVWSIWGNDVELETHRRG